MTITLYTNQSDDRVLTKTLSNATTIQNVRLLDSDNILSPTFDLITNPTHFNYLYAPALNRYYFITGIDIMDNNIYRIRCDVDVLMSFSDAIKNLRVIAHRSASNGNTFITDKSITSEQRPSISTYRVTNGLFTPHLIGANSRCFVVSVLAGKNDDENGG